VDRSLPLHLLLTVRLRRVLVRTITRRAIVVVAAVVTAVAVGSVVRSAEQTPSRWSETRPVAVAERDLAPGDVVDGAVVVLRELPVAAVAAAASDTVPLGAVVRYPIAAGEPLVADRLAPQGLTGVAALVPEGHRAVAVANAPAGTPPVHPGDQVDLVALKPGSATAISDLDPAGSEATSAAVDGATTLIDQALVVDVSDTAVTVAVPEALAPAVAHGAAQGLVVITLVGA
jgi:Flp pilus assembly protein CpaB